MTSLGIREEELQTLAGEDGREKREQIARSIRDILRGVIILGDRTHPLREVHMRGLPAGFRLFQADVYVDWKTPWREFIRQSCAETGDSSAVFRVIERSGPLEYAGSLHEVFFLWCGVGMTTCVGEVSAWFTENGFVSAAGRIPIAVLATRTEFVRELQSHGYPHECVGIVASMSTEDSQGLHLVCAWCHGSQHREADVYKNDEEWTDDHLFALRKVRLTP